MPELPELEVLKEKLSLQIKDKVILNLVVLKPYVLKNFFQGDLAGQVVRHIQRQGKYLIFELDSFRLIVHLMLRGSLSYRLPKTKIKKTGAAVLEFDDKSILEFSETGHKKRMSIYILPSQTTLGQIERLGPDPFDNDFTVSKLSDILNADGRQLKSLLCDQTKICGLGNAYTDEILWLACISPFKISTKLNDDETKRLYSAIRNVLEGAIAIIREKGISEKRTFLQIHNKKGKLCPRCEEPIQYISFSNSDTYYCPRCQTNGRKLKNRRISKFYR
ncbi:MAG: DNA-formamidopyrimidine glycosylase family protein [bacterium]